MAVGVLERDQLLAHLHFDRQLLAQLAEDRVGNGFSRLLRDAGALPQPAQQTLVEPLVDDHLAGGVANHAHADRLERQLGWRGVQTVAPRSIRAWLNPRGRWGSSSDSLSCHSPLGARSGGRGLAVSRGTAAPAFARRCRRGSRSAGQTPRRGCCQRCCGRSPAGPAKPRDPGARGAQEPALASRSTRCPQAVTARAVAAGAVSP